MNRLDWFFAHLFFACRSLLVRKPNVHVIVFAVADDPEAANEAGAVALRAALASVSGESE